MASPFRDFFRVWGGYKIKQSGLQSMHRKLLDVTSNTCVLFKLAKFRCHVD